MSVPHSATVKDQGFHVDFSVEMPVLLPSIASCEVLSYLMQLTPATC